MIIRDFIIKEHRVLTESQARAQLMEDPVFRHARQFGQLLVEYNLTKAQVQQLFKDVEQGATAAGSNRTGLGKAKDYTTKTIGNIISGARKWVKERPTYQAVDAEYNRAMTALGKVGGENGEANAITKAIYKYPRATGLAKWAIITAAGLATGGVGGAGVAAGLAAIDSAIKDKEIVDIVGDAAAAALVSGAVQGAAELGGQAMDAYRGLPSDAAVAANNAALGGFNDSGVPGGAASNINGLDLPADAATGDGTAMGDTTPSISGGQDIGGYNPDNVPGGTYTVMKGDQGGFIAQANGVPFKDLQALNPDITNWNKLPVGTELQLPPSGPNTGSVWQGTDMTAPGTGMNPTDVNNFRADNMARMQDQADAAYYAGKPDDFGVPARSNDAVGTGMPGSASSQGFTGTKVAGIPVIPGQPLTATQMAVADMSMQMGNQLSPVVQAAYDLAKRGVVRESIKFKILPAEKLIDQKSTVLSWALNESVGRRSISLNLTTLGTYTVFENVDRYRKAIMELKGVPGSTRPEYYRPDMMDAPTKPDKKPGLIGRGLNWLDKKAGQVGGALSNFGHQFTTNVTKEKLKMNWHQAGKPSDSDQLAAWLTKQGVPQEVVTTVYGKMGIPYVAPASAEPAVDPAAPATEPAKPAAGGAQKSLPFYGTNPTTGKAWTVDQLGATSGTPAPAPGPAPAATSAAAPAPAATGAATPSAEKFPGEDPTGPNYVGRLEVKRRQAARAAAAPAAPAKPNFAQQGGGYGSVNYAPNIKTGANLPKPTAPAAPAGTRVTSGGPTPDEQAKLAQRIAQATAKPVAEMLRMVETKEDVAKIKQFIDQTFVKYGAVTESAFVVRNRLIEHVTQVGAQRRREHARMS